MFQNFECKEQSNNYSHGISRFLFLVDIDKYRNVDSALFHTPRGKTWCSTSGEVVPWVLRSVPVGSCCSSHLSCAPELSSHENRGGGVDVYSCALSWGGGRRHSEPASKTTQKLSRFHGLMLLPLSEVYRSKEVIMKSCKHRNRKALRGRKEIKHARRDLGEGAIKMQNELHSICKSIWICICFLSHSSL